jgi:hypothetical protein
MIPFIGRQYYRLVQGSGTIGLGVSGFFLVFNTYGIWKESLQFYNIPLAPFVIAGLFGMVTMYWGGGYLMEHIGLYREYQSHANSEVNPQFETICKQVEEIHKEMCRR